MPRPEKVRAIEDIKGYFSASPSAFLTEFRGLPVEAQQELRRNLREAGTRYRVLKMTLTKRALHDLGHHDLDEWLTGPTAVAFVEQDPVIAAKALVDFSQSHDGLVIKAGMLGGRAIGADQIKKLATLDSREVLLSKLAGTMKGPLSRGALLMGSFTRSAASMFSQLADRKEEQ
ncbi:MAG: 50S ribosomal protein L10 [bacterium]|nr:50S ribosomal protein L10 [bacterium]MCY3580143.1 50S ribosomal protein L10 [bacterium]MDE0643379.1 50S ribosomal protein L10 [bacterium]